MGNDPRKVFARFCEEVTVLSYERWVYNKLFGSGEETIELLNDTAKTYFGYIQRNIERSMVLSVVRLLDPKESGGYTNLSFKTVLCELQGEINDDVIAACKSDLDKVPCENIKTMRNKMIAHLDLDYAVGVKPLDPLYFKEITDAVDCIEIICNAIQYELEESETYYGHYIDPQGPDLLLRYLKAGLASERDKRRLRIGR